MGDQYEQEIYKQDRAYQQQAMVEQLGGLLNNMPAGRRAPSFPSVESIRSRIAETEKLLVSLREVDALLNAHPDLERLIGTLKKLGSL